MKRILVIGAGAAGMMAAISAASSRSDVSVTLLEKMEKPGKKLLMTGNGRCNLTNLNPGPDDAFRSMDRLEVKKVLDRFSAETTICFFEKLGLMTSDRDGYVYPYSGQAVSVVDVLLKALRKYSVKVKCTEEVKKIEKKDQVFQVSTSGWTYEADAVILTGGSMAAPITGSDGNAYTLAKQLHHTVHTPLPALVPLKIKETWIRKLSGLRMPANVTLFLEENPNKRFYSERGEIQWTDYGISGIVVFQLSRYAAAALHNGQKVWVSVDLFADQTREDLTEQLKKRCADGTCEEFLYGLLPKKAIIPILEQLSIRPSMKAEQQFPHKAEALADFLKNIPLTVKGTLSFEHAQVCQGGVSLKELSCETMESKKISGLYFAGEILDVDGICGGYNLQWAWASGYLAGISSVTKENI